MFNLFLFVLWTLILYHMILFSSRPHIWELLLTEPAKQFRFKESPDSSRNVGLKVDDHLPEVYMVGRFDILKVEFI